MADATLYEDSFTVTDVNSQKYDRVSRISATSSGNDTILTLDVNTQLYPLSSGDHFHLLLATTLALDGGKDDGTTWRDVSKGESTLADHYEYVCHGRCYRFEDGEGENL